MTRKRVRTFPARANFPAAILTIFALAVLACWSTAAAAAQAASPWVQQAELLPPDANSVFGYSVAIDGNTAVVGAPGETVNGNLGQGAAYIYVNNGGVWTQEAVLTAADGAVGDVFGYAVSVSGNTVAIGAFGQAFNGSSQHGAVYVFDGNGGVWTQTAELTDTSITGNAAIGQSVSLRGDLLVVGAPVAIVNGQQQGAALVFARNGATWTEQAELTAVDGQNGDEFGKSVSGDGTNIVVGAPFKTVNSNPSEGMAYVFTNNGGSWSQYAELIAPDGNVGSSFGYSVSLSGNTAIIGAPNNNGTTPAFGSIYIWQLDFGTWSNSLEMIASDSTAGNGFGTSVSIDSTTGIFAVGAPAAGYNPIPSGEAYTYTLSNSFGTQQAILTGSDTAAADHLGDAVAVNGTTMLAGAWGHGADGNSGAAYVYTEAPTQLQITQEPAVGTVGSAIDPVMVQLEDASGNALTTSGVAVTLASNPAGVSGTLTVNTTDGVAEFDGLTFNAANSYTLTASADGLTSATGESIQISQVTQDIVFGSLPNVAIGSGPVAVSASASSGLPVSFASLTSPVCTVSGNAVTLVQIGTCTIQASQAGNAEYSAATPVSQSFQVTKSSSKLSPQTIVFPPIPDQVWGSAPITVVATTTSGLPVIFTSLTPRTCSNVAAVVTLIQPGVCAIEATQPGNDSYAPARPVRNTFTIARASQTIHFKKILESDIAEPFAVDAKATSGLDVTITSSTPKVCSVGRKGFIALHRLGVCTLTASQAGNHYYLPATPVTQSVEIRKRGQTIIFPNIPTQHLDPSLLHIQMVDLNATTTAGIPVQYDSLTPAVCRVVHLSINKKSKVVVTLRHVGVCTVEAWADGDARYYPVSPFKRSFLIE